MPLSLSVIIPAAGNSSRFRKKNRSWVSKLLLPLGNTSVLERSLKVLDSISEVREIIIAVNLELRKTLPRKFFDNFSHQVRLVKGGRTRAESVFCALKKTSKKTSHVLIHDGARPLLQKEWVQKLIHVACQADGVVLGRPIVPTVKRVQKNGEIIETPNRSELFEAETPQLFRKDVLMAAYHELGKRAFQATDDASLVEMIGGTVQTVSHEGSNLKITTNEDLLIAQKIMSQVSKEESSIRFGLGFDRHRLQTGRPFYLGGVRLKAPFGPVGHSDGDPLLHAVIDGMLGALGLGDIGDFFPDTNRKWKNVSSSVFSKKALQMVSEKGYQVAQIDATVFLEQPKLGDQKRKIANQMAKLFQLPASQISVKAKTAEGLGPEGKREAVSAQALVVLEKIPSP